MAKASKSTAVLSPNLGLYLDRPPISVPPGALQDGLNFRIQQGTLNNFNLGWALFLPATLNGPVTLIASFHLRAGNDILMFGTNTDLYKYSTGSGGTVRYITPIYATGTASASGTAVTGVGTLWNTGSPTNAKVGDEISFGSATQNDPAATWFVIDTVTDDTHLVLHTSAGTVGSGTYTIRKKYTGAANNTWSYDIFVNAQPASEDRIYLTNGIDFPVRWNGTDAQVTSLSSLGFTCQTLAVYKNSLVVANVVQAGTKKPTDLLISDVATPENFTTGLATQFKVSGTTDSIVRVARLGDYLVIYLQKNVIVAAYVGAPLVLTFRVAAAGKGLASTRGIAFYPAYHEFIGTDSLYTFDGSFARETSVHVWREIIRTEDPARISIVFTVQDEQRGDYIWAVPQTTDPGAGAITSPVAVAFVGHYLEPRGPMQPYLPKSDLPYSKRSFPFTSAGNWPRQTTLTWDQISTAWSQQNYKWNDQFFAAAFPLTIVGDANGQVWQLNAAQDANGVALNSFVKFGRRAVTDGNNRGLVTRVYPFVSKLSTPISVTVGLADFTLGPATITQTVSYDQSLPEGQYFASIFRVGRYMDVQFGTNGIGQPYSIAGYDVAVAPGGMR